MIKEDDKAFNKQNKKIEPVIKVEEEKKTVMKFGDHSRGVACYSCHSLSDGCGLVWRQDSNGHFRPYDTGLRGCI